MKCEKLTRENNNLLHDLALKDMNDLNILQTYRALNEEITKK